jgi:hypothetical protein
MKNIILILFLSIGALPSLYAQCYPDRHSTSWFDGWLSCETNENPNDLRGNSHWIEYEFNETKFLNQLKVWNVNDPDLLSYGAQNVVIDYSEDGITWIEYGQVTFPKAPGVNTYEGDNILNFDGLKAKKILITVLDNYGGECVGFSELKIQVDTTKKEDDNICISADIFPNPFNEHVNIVLQEKCLGDVYMAIEDVVGKTVREEEMIQLYQNKVVSTKNLNPGVYFVTFRSGDFSTKYKVVKY